jgi:hypothetical protein
MKNQGNYLLLTSLFLSFLLLTHRIPIQIHSYCPSALEQQENKAEKEVTEIILSTVFRSIHPEILKSRITHPERSICGLKVSIGYSSITPVKPALIILFRKLLI